MKGENFHLNYKIVLLNINIDLIKLFYTCITFIFIRKV